MDWVSGCWFQVDNEDVEYLGKYHVLVDDQAEHLTYMVYVKKPCEGQKKQKKRNHGEIT